MLSKIYDLLIKNIGGRIRAKRHRKEAIEQSVLKCLSVGHCSAKSLHENLVKEGFTEMKRREKFCILMNDLEDDGFVAWYEIIKLVEYVPNKQRWYRKV